MFHIAPSSSHENVGAFSSVSLVADSSPSIFENEYHWAKSDILTAAPEYLWIPLDNHAETNDVNRYNRIYKNRPA